MTTPRLVAGAVIGVLLAVALEVVAYGQEVTVTSPVPEQLRGGWVEILVFVLDRYALQLGALATAAVAAFKGWRPSMPTLRVHVEHAFSGGHVAVRWVRLARPPPPTPPPEEVEDISDRTPDDEPRPRVRPTTWVKP